MDKSIDSITYEIRQAIRETEDKIFLDLIRCIDGVPQSNIEEYEINKNDVIKAMSNYKPLPISYTKDHRAYCPTCKREIIDNPCLTAHEFYCVFCGQRLQKEGINHG